MTTVIMAENYTEASRVAYALGLGTDWIYPHDPMLVQGLQPTRVVYVAEWFKSLDITVPTAQIVDGLITDEVKVDYVPTIAQATSNLQAALSSPFVDPGTIQPTVAPTTRWRVPEPVKVVAIVCASVIVLAFIGLLWGGLL